MLPIEVCDKTTTHAASSSGAAGLPNQQGHSQAVKGTVKGSFPLGFEQLAFCRVALASGGVHFRKEDRVKEKCI